MKEEKEKKVGKKDVHEKDAPKEKTEKIPLLEEKHSNATPVHVASSSWSTVYVLLGLFLVLLVLFNLWQSFALLKTAKQQQITTTDAVLPAKLELALITTTSCPQCYDFTPIIEKLASLNVNITQKIVLNDTSTAARGLIQKYAISRLPAVLIKGEIEKSAEAQHFLAQQGKVVDGTYLLIPSSPPFIEVSTGRVREKVKLIHLVKENCNKCYNMDSLIEKLTEELGIENPEEISVDSEQGKRLVGQYQITAVPTLLFSPEAELYPILTKAWSQVGTVEDDGFYVMRNINPPYYNLTTKRVDGLITLTVLIDKSCTACYDALALNKPILLKMGLTINDERQISIEDPLGRSLRTQYNITKVPTIILTGDVRVYPFLSQVWEGVGTIEPDGAYVFRRVEMFQQPYKDLSLSQVITPASRTRQE